MTTFISEVFLTSLMKDFEEKLKKAGLTGAESKVYLGLLKYGSLNGSALAKRIGRGGLRALMREIIQYKSFSSFGATGRAYDFLYEMPRITREVTRKGNWARIIFHPKYSQHKLAGVKGIDCRYLSLEGETTTTIFGDCVSIHIVREKPFVVLIKNKEIARNYQSVFETLWEIAKQKPL